MAVQIYYQLIRDIVIDEQLLSMLQPQRRKQLFSFRLESDHLDVHRKSVGSSHEEVHFLPAATKDLLEYRFSIDNPAFGIIGSAF